MVQIDGMNWCTRFRRAVDSKLVRDRDPPCIKEHNGCGNCPKITYKVFKNGMEMDDNEDLYAHLHFILSEVIDDIGEAKCVICEAPCVQGKITCCDDHHEEFIQKMETQFGTYKKVLDMDTGATFKVPIRDIIEKGLKQQDLKNYPEWE